MWLLRKVRAWDEAPQRVSVYGVAGNVAFSPMLAGEVQPVKDMAGIACRERHVLWCSGMRASVLHLREAGA